MKNDLASLQHVHTHSSARRVAMLAALVTDALSICVVMGAVMLLSVSPLPLDADTSFSVLLGLLPLILSGLMLGGLYSPLFMHPAQELKRMFQITLLVGVFSGLALTIAGTAHQVVGHLLVVSILLMLIMPILRAMARILLGRTSWWGLPVLIFSDGKTGQRVVNLLRRWPELGLRPPVVVQEGGWGIEDESLHVAHRVDEAPKIAIRHQIGCAIVAMPEMSHYALNKFLDQQGKYFKHMFVVPDGRLAQCLWSTATTYDGLVGFAVQHFRWQRNIRRVKRVIDIAGAITVAILASPLMLFLAVLIKLDSTGPVFFRQERIGRKGQCFEVVKFRTMYQNAEERLEELLNEDEALREEYLLYHKLSDDPRITRIGRWMRRYSLDELPQLYNVLKGDMSLVGPRAYMPSELSKMNGMARAVLQSRPGLTGLWQVSGRNRLSFEERVDLDVHYLQNWSPWLDLYILVRTVPVVTTGEGAR